MLYLDEVIKHFCEACNDISQSTVISNKTLI